MGILFSFLTALSFACSHIFVRKGIEKSNEKSNGLLITIVINNLLLGFFLIVYYLLKSKHEDIYFSGILFFILAGLLTTGFGRMVFFNAIRLINPSRASGIKNAAPIFTALFGVFIIGEKLENLAGIGLLILLSALIIQGAVIFRKGDNALSGNQEWKGYAFAILASLFFGIGQGIRKQGLLILNNPFLGAWIGSMTAFTVIIIQLFVTKQLKQSIKINYEVLNVNFITAGILTAVGPISFFLASSLIPVSIVGAIAASEPLFTVLISYFFFKKEKLDIYIWLIALLILVGSTIIAISM